MSWGEIVAIVVSVIVTTLATTFINWLINKPKEWKNTEKKQHDELVEKIEETNKTITDFKTDVQKQFDEQTKVNVLLKDGLQQSLRISLSNEIEKCKKKGYATTEDRQSVQKLYDAYHGLGANGFMDREMQRFDRLPEHPRKKEGKSAIIKEEDITKIK